MFAKPFPSHQTPDLALHTPVGTKELLLWHVPVLGLLPAPKGSPRPPLELQGHPTAVSVCLFPERPLQLPCSLPFRLLRIGAECSLVRTQPELVTWHASPSCRKARLRLLACQAWCCYMTVEGPRPCMHVKPWSFQYVNEI